MITGEIKNKLDNLWDAMWSNQMTNPLIDIQQITYLIFIKMLDDNQIKKEKNANAFHTKVINPTFKEGVYKQVKDEDGNVTMEVTYEDLRWHNFAHFDRRAIFFGLKVQKHLARGRAVSVAPS